MQDELQAYVMQQINSIKNKATAVTFNETTVTTNGRLIHNAHVVYP
jgi:hypothetical protein